MKKFIIDTDVFKMFSELEIGVLSVKNIENSGVDKSSELEKVCRDLYKKLSSMEEKPKEIEDYKMAMKKFKTKKGAKASIDAMSARIAKGNILGSINPVVDIYNIVSLSTLFTCGGEDLDKIQGDMRLCFAKGDEDFIPLGENEVKPPKEGELIYRDDMGAVVRGWLWREADRTKITKDSKNVLLYMELIDKNRKEEFKMAMEKLKNMLEKELNGSCILNIINIENPSCNI